MIMPQQADSIPVPPLPQSRHQSKTKSCPFCAETIRYAAIKCRFCGEFLSGDRRAGEARPQPQAQGGQPKENSAQNEETGILWAGRPSAFALTGDFLKTACFIAVCWAVYHYPVMVLATYVPKVTISVAWLVRIEAWLDLAALGLGLAALFALFWRILSLKSTWYEVTPDRIEWSRGIFDRKVDNLDMFRVIDLKLRRSLIECLIGIGTVIILTQDESDPTFEFRSVHHCRYLYDTLKEAGLNADKKRGVIHLE
jgi:hypothetical protein